jgi:hypothetical protein
VLPTPSLRLLLLLLLLVAAGGRELRLQLHAAARPEHDPQRLPTRRRLKWRRARAVGRRSAGVSVGVDVGVGSGVGARRVAALTAAAPIGVEERRQLSLRGGLTFCRGLTVVGKENARRRRGHRH